MAPAGTLAGTTFAGHGVWTRDHAGLQLKPAFGYATAIVVPFLKVYLSLKSGQCSRLSRFGAPIGTSGFLAAAAGFGSAWTRPYSLVQLYPGPG